MIEAGVPELADGGYWYVVPAVVLGDEVSPGHIPGVGWCAWYEGQYAVVRCPAPVVGFDCEPLSAGNILSVAQRPYGRVGGT